MNPWALPCRIMPRFSARYGKNTNMLKQTGDLDDMINKWFQNSF